MNTTPKLRRWHVWSTLAVLALSVSLTLLGLFRAGLYAGLPEQVVRTRSEDLAILAFGVPALAYGLWATRRGSVRGRLVWLGGLAFMAYVWGSRALQLAFNDAFLGYVALTTLSAFTLVGGLLLVDPHPVHRRLDGHIRHRLYAGVLGLIAAGLAALWLSDVVPATLSGTTPAIVRDFGEKGLATLVVDLGILVPALAVAAGWLWQRRPWGYVTAGVLLTFGALLAPSLTAITVVDVLNGVPLTVGMIAGTVVPPAVAAAFALAYLRALPDRPGQPRPGPDDREDDLLAHGGT